MNNKILILLAIILVLPMASAEDIGTFKTNENFQMTNFCNSGDCTFMNLSSVTYPNGSVLYFNVEMTKTGQEFNYSLFSDVQGAYNFKTCADPGGILTCESDSFSLTKTGTKFETQESLIYIVLSFGVFILFALSLYFTIVTPYSNETNADNAVIQITRLKYIKLGFILLTWVLLTWFLNILIGLSDNFTSLTLYYGFFGFIFETMNNLALPLGIVIIIICFFEIIRDANIQENIKKFGSSLR